MGGKCMCLSRFSMRQYNNNYIRGLKPQNKNVNIVNCKKRVREE